MPRQRGRHPCLEIREVGAQVVVRYGNDEFAIPKLDVLLVPIVHSSAEELARYLAGEMRRELDDDGLRRVRPIEVGVEETPGQGAYYREAW